MYNFAIPVDDFMEGISDATTREELDEAISSLKELLDEAEYRRDNMPNPAYIRSYSINYDNDDVLVAVPVSVPGSVYTAFFGFPFLSDGSSRQALQEYLERTLGKEVILSDKSGDTYGTEIAINIEGRK